MSAKREEMIAAAGALEEALQLAATAYGRYLAAYRTVSRAAYRTDPNGNRQLTLEQTIGAARLHELVVRRFRALGFGPVLNQARTSGTLAETWVTDLTSKIRQVLP